MVKGDLPASGARASVPGAARTRASLNQATVRYANLDESLAAAAAADIPSVGLWREPVLEVGLHEAARRVADSGLRVSSLCRAGYYADGTHPDYRAALDDSRRAIEETAVLAGAGAPGSAPVLVVVPGGLRVGSRDLAGTRAILRDAVGELEADAVAAGVTLAIEALHPMMASDRGVISTLRQAIDIAEQFGPNVGVVVDAYHVWWDPDVLEQINRAGCGGRIASYQVSDWVTPLPAGALMGRGLMGDGIIDFGPMTRAIIDSGFLGDVEIEVYSQAVWDAPYVEVAKKCVEAFDRHIPVPAN